ncbi:MAG: aldo/keto reductase [Luteolibacter sp.]
MKYLSLGESGLSSSVIGFGAWAIGGGAVWGGTSDDAESIRTIQTALDAGINLLDTAPAYGWGHSERLIAKAIDGRRDQVLLATKCGLWWDDDRGSYFTEFNGKSIHRSLRPDTIAIEVERSLNDLATDRIDLYQVHWPAVDPEKTPIADTMAALLKLKDEGKILAIGVCNLAPEELEEYLSCGAIATHQFRYSMLSREPEKEMLPLCQKHKLATLTYMSLEQGLLTGKIGMDHVFQEGEFRTSADWFPWLAPQNRRRILDLLDGWKPLCETHHCTLAQLVLAWTLAQPGVTHVLAGARKHHHIQETAAAADIDLTATDLTRITADLSALGQPVS